MSAKKKEGGEGSPLVPAFSRVPPERSAVASATPLESSSFQLMEIQLKSCYSVQSSTRIFAHEYVEEGIPFFTSKDVIDKALGSFSNYEYYISRNRFLEISQKYGYPKDGDLLLSSVGNRSGIPYYVQNEREFYFKDGNIIWLNNFCGLDSKYLSFWLRSSTGQDALQSVMIGSAQKALTIDSIRNLYVQIPPLPQQQKIAMILSSLDDKIALNRAMNETLEQIAQALFKSWFVDFDPVRAKAAGRKPDGMDAATVALFPDSFEESELGPIPKGWEVKTMADLAEIVGGSTPSTKEDSYWTEGCYNWSTPKDLSNNTDKILLTTERKITEEGLKTISSGLLPEGTILMSSRAPVGYLAVAKIPVAINQGYIAMKSNAEDSNLYLLFYCESIMSEIKQKAGGTTFAEISKKVFRDILILNPPNKIMQLFHEIVGSIYTKKTTNKSESMRIEQIRDSLLPKLLSGEIRV